MATRANNLVSEAMKEHASNDLAAGKFELNAVIARVSLLESMLAQRQEEIVQTWHELDDQKLKFEELAQVLAESLVQREELERKLKGADGWIFKISGEKTMLEHQLGLLEIKSENLTKRCAAAEEAVTVTRHRLDASLASLKETQNEHERLIEETRLDREALKQHSAAMLQDVEVARADLEMRLADSIQESGALQRQLTEVKQEKIDLQRRLTDASHEIAFMTRRLHERETELSRSETKAEWLRMVLILVTSAYSQSIKGRLSSMLPANSLIKKQRKRLKKAGLFDATEYSATYPDVAESDIDPLRHYLLHGLAEGRALKGDN